MDTTIDTTVSSTTEECIKKWNINYKKIFNEPPPSLSTRKEMIDYSYKELYPHFENLKNNIDEMRKIVSELEYEENLFLLKSQPTMWGIYTRHGSNKRYSYDFSGIADSIENAKKMIYKASSVLKNKISEENIYVNHSYDYKVEDNVEDHPNCLFVIAKILNYNMIMDAEDFEMC